MLLLFTKLSFAQGQKYETPSGNQTQSFSFSISARLFLQTSSIHGWSEQLAPLLWNECSSHLLGRTYFPWPCKSFHLLFYLFQYHHQAYPVRRVARHLTGWKIRLVYDGKATVLKLWEVFIFLKTATRSVASPLDTVQYHTQDSYIDDILYGLAIL